MIIGVGIDIIEIDRIKKNMSYWQDKFLKRIFTTKEILYCQKKKFKEQHFAVRFAAKEALFKTLLTKRKNIHWHDIEILANNNKPFFVLHNKIKKIYKDRNIFLSLSHSKKYAQALVVVEKKEE